MNNYQMIKNYSLEEMAAHNVKYYDNKYHTSDGEQHYTKENAINHEIEWLKKDQFDLSLLDQDQQLVRAYILFYKGFNKQLKLNNTIDIEQFKSIAYNIVINDSWLTEFFNSQSIKIDMFFMVFIQNEGYYEDGKYVFSTDHIIETSMQNIEYLARKHPYLHDFMIKCGYDLKDRPRNDNDYLGSYTMQNNGIQPYQYMQYMDPYSYISLVKNNGYNY